MRINAQIINALWAEHGPAMREFLLEEILVSDLNKELRRKGMDTAKYPADRTLPRSAVYFGPKLGAFYANLSGAEGYLTMDRWWSRTFNRYRGDLLDAPTRQGLDNLRTLILADRAGLVPIEPVIRSVKKKQAAIDELEAQLDQTDIEEMSDDQVLSIATDIAATYAEQNYKGGTAIQRMANTVYKAAFENINDQPFNTGDRGFMIDAVTRAQELLEDREIVTSIADIQAILWYYEKRLYAEMGARATPDVSYEEVANRIVGEIQAGTGGPGHDAPGQAVVRGPDGAGFEAAQSSPIGDDTVDAGGPGRGRDTGEVRPDRTELGNARGDEGRPRAVDATTFSEAMEAAGAALGPVAAQVSTVEPSRDVQRFLLDGGASGYAIDGDNLIGVFFTPVVSPPGAAQRILSAAVEQGVRRLDGFATYLPKTYARGGLWNGMQN